MTVMPLDPLDGENARDYVERADEHVDMEFVLEKFGLSAAVAKCLLVGAENFNARLSFDQWAERRAGSKDDFGARNWLRRKYQLDGETAEQVSRAFEAGHKRALVERLGKDRLLRRCVSPEMHPELEAHGFLAKTVTLFRPVGQAEHDLIVESDFTCFPPRLPEQPIFYPVTNEAYASQIARDWNTKEPTGVGYVTRFEVDAGLVATYDTKFVGAQMHEEYWIPAEALDTFNSAIVGPIEVISEFRGVAE